MLLGLQGGRARYWWIAVRCLLFFPSPRRSRTPIRWLCLRAFAYLADCSGRPLRPAQLGAMSRLIDLGVFLNRCYDGKTSFVAARYRALRKGLPEPVMRDYLRALKQAESRRPPVWDQRAVLSYRRAVLDLSLLALFRIAEQEVQSVLSPLVCLIQLVDDLLDSQIDRSLGLPTLVSSPGSSSRQLALELWTELKQHRHPRDRPLVGVGFLIYVLARLLGLLRGAREALCPGNGG